MRQPLVIALLVGGAALASEAPPGLAKPPVGVVPRQPPEASTQEINDRLVRQIADGIVGRENQPAGQVFKNVKLPHLLRE